MELLADPLVERLGWTLVHTLWQGALIALGYALASWWARGRGPELRYALSVGALALLALAPVATFLWIGPGATAHAAAGAATFSASTAMVLREAAAEFDLIAALEPALPWIVALWCTGVLVSALRVWDAWRELVALRRSAAPLGGRELAELVAKISAELGITRSVRIARSALVESPTVVGWLEPLVLVPTAALAGLTPQQLAMILAHELAHIRRHDYLVNALQTVLETLLFFHPAVHWISGRARHEREECCDAVAVRFGGDAIAYARALTELEELRGLRASLALAATGGVLLDRIERLLGRRPSRQQGTALASACALATLTALTVTLGAPELGLDDLARSEPRLAAPAPAASPAALPVLPARTGEVAPPSPRAAVGAIGAVAVGDAPASPSEAAAPATGAVLETVAAVGAAPLALDAGGAPPAPVGEVAAVEAAPVEAAPAVGAGPVYAGGEQIVGVTPSYPYGARSRRIGGVVTARLHVDARGVTTAVEVIAADPPELFDRAVVRALSNWRYAPLLEDGVPVAREIVQQLEFQPEDAGGCRVVTGTRICRMLGNEPRGDGVTVIKLR